MDFQPIIQNLPMILDGLVITLKALVLGSILAIVVGFLLGLCTLMESPFVRKAIGVYVYILRGTPELVLLFLIFFGLPMVGITLPAFGAGVVALGLQSSAYILEVVRAGMESVGQEQREAAQLDGASELRTLWEIILPQSVRQMIPGTLNQVIGLLKGTSLLAVISVGETTRALQLITSRYFIPLESYLLLAAIYLVIIAAITRLGRSLERVARRRLC